jgi:hypothetical protein
MPPAHVAGGPERQKGLSYWPCLGSLKKVERFTNSGSGYFIEISLSILYRYLARRYKPYKCITKNHEKYEI